MAKAYVALDNGPNWWRDVPGYRGKYRVNRLGDVQRVFPSGLVRDLTPYRKQGKKPRNRLFLHLSIDGKTREVQLLKIIAETWYPDHGRNMVPYHRNGIQTDNRVDNIGYVTRQELGRRTGHMSGKRKSVVKVSAEGAEVAIYRSARQAAMANYISYQAVLDRCHGKVKNPYGLDGYTYRFEE